MVPKSRTNAFIEALTHAESQGDTGPLLAMFGPAAELQNPALPASLRGPEGAREFWDAYLATFRTIHSEFRMVLESDRGAALEWTSRGSAPDGRELVYDGVSIIEFEGDLIRRFRAYFDPRALGAQLQSRTPRAA